MKRKVIVIGAGITGMAAAAFLAAKDFEVEIFEKHEQAGGRASRFFADGFSFDLGPQILVLPEILTDFFSRLEMTSYLPEFKRLDPAYRIFNAGEQAYDIPGEPKQLSLFFKEVLPSGEQKLNRYLEKAQKHYNEIIEKRNYLDRILAADPWYFHSHDRFVKSLFRDSRLVNILLNRYPFVTQSLRNNSALKYALNYSFITHGIMYPEGGIPTVIQGFTQILDKLNVPIYTSSPMENFDVIDDKVTGIITHGKNFHADYFVSAMDYRATEQHIPKEFRNYAENQWEEKYSSGSLFIFYLGIGKKLKNIPANAMIYNRQMTKKSIRTDDLDIPMMHISCPSKLDSTLAPDRMETLIVRVLVPASVEDTGKIREHYFKKSLQLIEEICGESLQKVITYKKTLSHSDFESEFGTHLGRVFGWMHSRYAENLKNRKLTNARLHNLFYAEYPVLTGMGISSAILSGEIAAQEVVRLDSRID